jgi:hypothetical protein
MLSAHNLHLQRNGSTWAEAGWSGAGAVIDALGVANDYFIAGSLGAGDPEPDTYEGILQQRFSGWGLIPATEVPAARSRAPQHGYFPLDRATVDSADAILHVTG